MLKKLPILAGVLAIGVVVAGAANAAQTTSQNITGSGSDTTYWMMTALGDLYQQSPGCNNLASPQPLNGSCVSGATADSENFYHDFVSNRFPIGSSGGVNQICKKGLTGVARIDFARSSRVPLPASAGGSDCTGLRFIGYARDGITWECFPGASGAGCSSLASGTNTLTVTQLKNIFVNCTVTNWSQVGGGNVAMHVYVPQANSGTGITWAAALGVTLASGQALTNCVANPNNPGQPGSNVSPENTNSLIHTNGDEANAIFPWSVGVYHRTYGSGFTGNDGSSLGKVNGIQATNANIQSATFPISRYLFNVYCAGDPANGSKCGTSAATPAWVTRFVGPQGFLCKNESKHLDSSSHPILDPLTGQPYRIAPDASGNPRGEIPSTISAQGFVPLKKQSTSTYCVTFST